MLSTRLHLQWAPYRPYTRQAVHANAPLSGGVYKLAYARTDGSLIVFYVGQADNLDRRLKQHLSEYETNACLQRHLSRCKCYFTFAEVSTQRGRDGAERSLYDFFKPTCNLITPPGPPIPINAKNG